MKRWTRGIFHHWQIKLTCLAAATVIWLFLKHAISGDSGPPSPPGLVLPSDK